MGFTFTAAIISQGWVNMLKISFLLPNDTTLENPVICVIERLLSEYKSATPPTPQIKLIRKVENKPP